MRTNIIKNFRGVFYLNRRAKLALLHDVLASCAAFLVSLYITLGDNFVQISTAKVVIDAFAFMLISGVVYTGFGLYRGLWRYASVNDMTAIFFASFCIIPCFVFFLFFENGLGYYPRTSFVLNPLLIIGFLAGPRLLYRAVKDKASLSGHKQNGKVAVLLIGLGDNAELFIREMLRAKNAPYKIMGIIDGHSKNVGNQIRGIQVVGHLPQFEMIIQKFSKQGTPIQRIIIADERLRGADLRHFIAKAESFALPVSRLPKVTDLKSDDGSAHQIQPICIEDILGRPQNVMDSKNIQDLIRGKRVLITGAGGSIGSEIVRQITQYSPSHLILVDHSEFLLYSIDQELEGISKVSLLADIRNKNRLEAIFKSERPQIVFHAAALKHVPIVEEQPLEGILTNVMGTKNVADLSVQYGASAMVVISTDKAVNPTNIMGTTKRLAEAYCQSLDFDLQHAIGKTRFVTVRFGNVLGSNGSVVPLFQKQLAKGGPITITHPDVIRYFMTIREAVELVLQSAAIGVNLHDRGKIFVLDMGEPIKIIDLAHQMIRLAGLHPGEDIKIVYTGLRPGEKLYEELFYQDEHLEKTSIEGIFLASPRYSDFAVIEKSISELIKKCILFDFEGALTLLKHLVPEYKGRIDLEMNSKHNLHTRL